MLLAFYFTITTQFCMTCTSDVRITHGASGNQLATDPRVATLSGKVYGIIENRASTYV